MMEVGDKIDNFVITEVLSGGMSEVYRVFDGSERYVLKMVKEDATEEGVKLFRREIRILRKMSHPNIMEIIADRYDSDRPYYVMPNCGKSFVDLACCQIADLELLDYAISFCEAIQYAHELGIYHRDIKPQNVLLYKGVVKVSDFGLSRFVNRDTTTITQTGSKAGTFGYMPPEYLNGEFKDGSVESDVYMIGKTLYYVFSHGKDISNVRSEMVSTPIFAIVDKCTKDGVKQRFSSVSTIIDELKNYRDLLKAAETAPKTIKEIKETLEPNTPQYYKEVYKTLSTLGYDPMEWGNTLMQLDSQDLFKVLTYNRDSIVAMSLHFIDSLSNPSEYIQFRDIDEYARFTKLLVDVNTDESIKQNLILFMLRMSINYNRFSAMKIVASIMNEQIDKDYSRYKIFVMLHQKMLLQICEQLDTNSDFNNKIKPLLKVK